jgi:hypothetical protein
MRGEGKMAKSIKQLFDVSVRRFMKEERDFNFNLEAFDYRAGEAQLSLF